MWRRAEGSWRRQPVPDAAVAGEAGQHSRQEAAGLHDPVAHIQLLDLEAGEGIADSQHHRQRGEVRHAQPESL